MICCSQKEGKVEDENTRVKGGGAMEGSEQQQNTAARGKGIQKTAEARPGESILQIPVQDASSLKMFIFPVSSASSGLLLFADAYFFFTLGVGVPS